MRTIKITISHRIIKNHIQLLNCLSHWFSKSKYAFIQFKHTSPLKINNIFNKLRKFQNESESNFHNQFDEIWFTCRKRKMQFTVLYTLYTSHIRVVVGENALIPQSCPPRDGISLYLVLTRISTIFQSSRNEQESAACKSQVAPSSLCDKEQRHLYTYITPKRICVCIDMHTHVCVDH